MEIYLLVEIWIFRNQKTIKYNYCNIQVKNYENIIITIILFVVHLSCCFIEISPDQIFQQSVKQIYPYIKCIYSSLLKNLLHNYYPRHINQIHNQLLSDNQQFFHNRQSPFNTYAVNQNPRSEYQFNRINDQLHYDDISVPSIKSSSYPILDQIFQHKIDASRANGQNNLKQNFRQNQETSDSRYRRLSNQRKNIFTKNFQQIYDQPINTADVDDQFDQIQQQPVIPIIINHLSQHYTRLKGHPVKIRKSLHNGLQYVHLAQRNQENQEQQQSEYQSQNQNTNPSSIKNKLNQQQQSQQQENTHLGQYLLVPLNNQIQEYQQSNPQQIVEQQQSNPESVEFNVKMPHPQEQEQQSERQNEQQSQEEEQIIINPKQEKIKNIQKEKEKIKKLQISSVKKNINTLKNTAASTLKKDLLIQNIKQNQIKKIQQNLIINEVIHKNKANQKIKQQQNKHTNFTNKFKGNLNSIVTQKLENKEQLKNQEKWRVQKQIQNLIRIQQQYKIKIKEEQQKRKQMEKQLRELAELENKFKQKQSISLAVQQQVKNLTAQEIIDLTEKQTRQIQKLENEAHQKQELIKKTMERIDNNYKQKLKKYQQETKAKRRKFLARLQDSLKDFQTKQQRDIVSFFTNIQKEKLPIQGDLRLIVKGHQDQQRRIKQKLQNKQKVLQSKMAAKTLTDQAEKILLKKALVKTKEQIQQQKQNLWKNYAEDVNLVLGKIDPKEITQKVKNLSKQI